MLIRYPHTVRDKKYLLLLVIIDILKEHTDPEHDMKKTELCEKIEAVCGFMPARNTVYDKLNSLEYAGFPIVQDQTEGVYYDGHELSDGELRFLLDSVLYSDFLTPVAADEIIEALTAFGSPELQKYIRRQKVRADQTRKSMQHSVFASIEEIQSAISKNRQISCNYMTYRPDLTTECVYPEPVTVDPYEMVYKNGKYYLLGAVSGSDQMQSWRVDRLCEVKPLETRCREIPLLREINASGGISAYADSQPDLCGGVVETFKIQCAKTAIDEIVDVFGKDFSIAPEQRNNYDDETVILAVRATRESMKAWAFTQAERMVVIAPDDFRKEISASLREAGRLYQVTGKPLHLRIFTAKDLAEAVRFTRQTARKSLIYHGHGNRREKERISLAELLKIPDLTALKLTDCILEQTEILRQLPMLNRLGIVNCEFDADAFPALTGIAELETDDPALAKKLCKSGTVSRLSLFGSKIRDASMISEISSLRRVSFVYCRELKDCSALCSADAPEIEKLELRNCPELTDFSFLDGMKHLKTLRLRDVPVTPEVLLRLQERKDLKIN